MAYVKKWEKGKRRPNNAFVTDECSGSISSGR